MGSPKASKTDQHTLDGMHSSDNMVRANKRLFRKLNLILHSSPSHTLRAIHSTGTKQNLNDRKDRRIDFVMQQIMERLNHNHPVCSGRPRNELTRRRSVIPLNADTAFDDNLERLENKDIPIPRYLHEIAERLLTGPEVFVFDSW